MVRIYDTFKTIKEISKHIKPNGELGAMDNYYQTTINENVYVNCVKLNNETFINEFNYTDTVWFEKTFGDFNDPKDAKTKSQEIDLVFRLDDIKLPGKHEKKYRYLGAFQLVSVTKEKGMTIREWHYINNYDKVEE